jgi:hypothetical protein
MKIDNSITPPNILTEINTNKKATDKSSSPNISPGPAVTKLNGLPEQNPEAVYTSKPIAYRITKEQSTSVHAERVKSDISAPKQYKGVNKINQVLRHIATSVYDEAYNSAKNMIEVQCSVIDGKLHISSNFNSQYILEYLHQALNKERPDSGYRPENFPDKTAIDQEYSSRPNRHKAKMIDFTINSHRFNKAMQRMQSEIDKGEGLVSSSGISVEQTKQQATSMLYTLRDALTKAKDGDFSLIDVHDPKVGGADSSSRTTMHAEQNIESHIALIKNNLEGKGSIIIPMAGRFVACATCNEVEHHAKKSGIFNPDGGLILHRSSERVGMAYANETQYLASSTLAEGKAEEIAENFRTNASGLSSYQSKIVYDHAFDTASESEPESEEK